jgi:hypothetical protein
MVTLASGEKKEKVFIARKCRDHDHFTGRYRAALCDNCNFWKQQKIKNFRLIVWSHNLKGYDGHFFINYVCPYIPQNNKGKEFVIAKSTEKFNGFDHGRFSFRDTMAHLPGSLEELANSTQEFPNYEKYGYNIKHKGIYPYEWFDDYNKLLHEGLPEYETFKNTLDPSKTPTEKEYKEAKRLFKELGFVLFKDWHEYYLRGDVLLLADAFTGYRKKCLKTHGLDPAWYWTGPSFTEGAALKYTGAEIKLVKQREQLEILEHALRGGICNKGEVSELEVGKDGIVSIGYLDMKNLYGKAMMRALPYEIIDGFYEVTMEHIMNYSFEWDMGFFAIVDIECPKELRDKLNAYPLFPTKEDGKLKVTLRNKEFYCVHAIYLQLGIQIGYKVSKIHGGVWFKQRAYLKSYIELNTELRNMAEKAGDKLGEMVYKALNNAFYGKLCQNPRKYGEMEKYNNDNPMLQYKINHPRTKRVIDLNKISLVEFSKKTVYFDRPIYVAVALLDISKYIMADFWYNGIKKVFKEDAMLAYTDTDSLVIEFKRENTKELIETHPDLKDRFGETPGKMKVEAWLK